MNIDLLTFFEIFLAGFITVWSFRYFTNSKKAYAEFEWFALSGFWGVLILALVSVIPDMKEPLKNLFNNPFATGITMSILGFIIGWLGSLISKTKFFHRTLDFIGKDRNSN